MSNVTGRDDAVLLRTASATKLPIVMDSRVRIPRAALPDEVVREMKAEFEHENPEFYRKRRMNLPTRGEPPTHVTWREEGNFFSFPRGGYARVRGILETHGIRRSVSDRRTLGREITAGIPDHRYALYPYQRAAMDAAIAKENCIVRAPTGSGKTTVAFALAATLKLPTLVIVWNGGLFQQWLERAEKELGLDPDDVGQIRGDLRKIRPLTIAMQQTLAARGVDPELQDAFGVVICDELQRFAAPTLFEAVDPFPAKYRIGISADESRKDGKEYLIYDLFGGVAADIPRSDLIESGHVLEVEIRVVPTQFFSRIRGDFDKLLGQMMLDPSREALVDEVVKDEAIENDAQVMVLSHRREHCLRIDQRVAAMGVKTGTLLGGKDNEREFQATVDGLRDGRLQVGVGTVQAIGQGLDLPTVSVGIMTTPLATNRQMFGQVRGRMCRTAIGKSGARLYYLWDKFLYGLKHLENLVRWNSRVLVWEGNEWVEARGYLRAIREGAVATA